MSPIFTMAVHVAIHSPLLCHLWGCQKAMNNGHHEKAASSTPAQSNALASTLEHREIASHEPARDGLITLPSAVPRRH